MRTKDELNESLRQRFTGHEVPVDANVWQAISARVAAPTAGADEVLRGSLKEKFTGHEMAVDPGLWASISGQAGIGAAASGGIGTGWIAAGVAAVILTVGAWYLTGNEMTSDHTSVAEVRTERPQANGPRPAGTEEQVAGRASTTASDPKAPPQEEKGDPEGTTMATDRANAVITAQDEHALKAPVPASDHVDRHMSGEEQGELESIPEPTLPPATTTSVTAETPDPAVPAERPEAPAAKSMEQGEDTNGTGAPGHAQEAGPTTSGTPATEAPVTEAPKAEFHLFLPNVFTPNGDGTNDQYEISCVGCTDVSVMITDSYTGKLVFAAQDLHPWNANDMSGAPCPVGQYTVFVQAMDAIGQRHREKVYLQLMR
ncbi:MAG: gliding motility-associated C-terminal domain-containing protein [Flavobacteriales bacterium]|nr:gliding motility-associated C-terminal domain-containing protein [Flavobacteriales bacterium]MCB9166974.1 gliding motility-associated C-terminal domain-containing protein [Flavobacteriales bacterium]